MNSVLRMFPQPKQNRKLIKTPLTHDSNRLARSNHPTIVNIFTTFLLFEKFIFYQIKQKKTRIYTGHKSRDADCSGNLLVNLTPTLAAGLTMKLIDR